MSDTMPLTSSSTPPTAPLPGTGTRSPGPLPATAPEPARARSGIVVRNLSKTYRRGQVRLEALRDVTLTIGGGSQVAVMGPSGSGKTTLLQCLAGVVHPTSGSVLVEGTEIVGMDERRLSAVRLRRFGFVFQDGQLLPELSAQENVALPLLLSGSPRRAALERAEAVCAALGLAPDLRARPGQLSGGQAQRVAIARAVVATPQVVFADEPTGALDQATGREVMEVLTSTCRASGATLVLVTHDPGVAAWCGRTLVVRDGLVHEGAPALVGGVVPGAALPAADAGATR